jgi:signal transduction histidine kinase
MRRSGGNRQAHDTLVSEQAALRRVATLVARGVRPSEVFTAVTREVAGIAGADLAAMSRFEPDGSQTVVAAWPDDREYVRVGTRLPVLEGENVARRVLETGRPARIDDWSAVPGPVAGFTRRLGVRATVGSPVVVAGRLWGLVVVDSRREEPLPGGTESRLESFTELVATAIANSEARAELSRLADEQSALRRVATLVARGLLPGEGLAVVAEEVGKLLGAEIVHMVRYDPDDTATAVAAWSDGSLHLPVGERFGLEGVSTAALVRRSRAPARVDDYGTVQGEIADAMRARGIRSSVGSPIVVEGRVWGAMIVASARREPQPADTEARLAGFTELVATAIANAHAGAEVRRLAEQQAALRRVATLVARESSPAVLFAAVADEVGRLLDADTTRVFRYEPDDTATVVAASGEALSDIPLGTRVPLGGDSVVARVRRTGRPARMDSFEGARGVLAALLRDHGVRSGVGAPIVVGGRLWGAVVAGSTRPEPLPGWTEARIDEFTELLATAIANADSRAELAASRARIVAAGDEARRRIERNLHDGAQQRLVSLGLLLRAAEARAPEGELREQLGLTVSGLAEVLEELQEISRGLHPALLSSGGLEVALGALARRAAMPVELDLRVRHRLPEQVEVTVYYVVSEALTNAAKHADASHVQVDLGERDGRVVLAIRDDGRGGADPAVGSGLIGLRDRVEAVGGRIDIASPAGAGTSLRVTLPSRSAAGG